LRAVQLVREPGEVEKDQKIHAKPEQRSREIQTLMAFFSVALYAIALLLFTEQAHARPLPATGCEHEGKFYKIGEEAYENTETKCNKVICSEQGVVIWDLCGPQPSQ